MIPSRFLSAAALALPFLLASLGSASADSFDTRFATAASHEVRVGVMYREPDGPETGFDVDVEALANIGWTFSIFDRLAAVRPLVGASISTEGYTHFGYAQLALTVDVTERVFIEGAFGGTVHNGDTNGTDPDRLNLGCNLLFRESGTLGYRVTEQVSVMATISHSSNSGLCDFNRGMTNFGARVGFNF